MLHVYLLDSEGDPHSSFSQPRPVSDPTAISAWLHIYSVMSLAPKGEELVVTYFSGLAIKRKAILTTGEYQAAFNEDDNVSLYMYAKDIIPIETNVISKPR